MSRREHFDSCVSRQVITREKQKQIVDRQMKRYLQAKGMIGPKLPRLWQLDIGESVPIRVLAYTKSEARSMIKKELGVKRLPSKIKLQKVIYESEIY